MNNTTTQTAEPVTICAGRTRRAVGCRQPIVQVDATHWQHVNRVPVFDHPAEPITESAPICFSNRVHEPHPGCAGLDADTLFDRTMDARS